MTRSPLGATMAVGVLVALALACKGGRDASDDAGTAGESAESGDPAQFGRAIVESENPLALDNPTVETVVWPLWGGAFAADQSVVLRASLTAADSGEDGLILAVAGEESIGRGVALVHAAQGWELQLRDGDSVDAVPLGGDATAEIQLSVGVGGSSVEATLEDGTLETLDVEPPLVAAGGTLGVYVSIGAGSTLELGDVASTFVVTPDPALGTPLRELAGARGITIGSATDVWPPLHDVGFEQMLGEQFDLAAPSEFYWTTTRAEGPDTFFFVPADTMVNYALVHDQQVRGYHLIWDLELPQWLLDIADIGDSVALEDALRNHVETIVGRYRGRVQEWVVANEAIWGPEVTGDPALAEWAESPWTDVLGVEYIETSFRAARDADPDAILMYNETGAETLGAKSDFMYDMVADFVARDVPIDGVGLQFHIDAAAPPENGDMAANIQRFVDLGVDVYITELDVNLIALPGTEQEKLDVQATIFADVLDACLSVPGCRSYTMWGFTDRYAWYEREEGAEAPLVFDDEYGAKPAFWAVQQRLAE
jgi:endo-1,4-beta-xylanase